MDKKFGSSREHLAKMLDGSKRDAKGLRYEQKCANYFASQGWRPQTRVKKYGFEYDLYDMQEKLFGGEYHLVVECKCKDRVSAKDVVRFIRKVNLVYRNLPEDGSFVKNRVFAYFCCPYQIDPDAAAAAESHTPPVVLLQIEE